MRRRERPSGIGFKAERAGKPIVKWEGESSVTDRRGQQTGSCVGQIALVKRSEDLVVTEVGDDLVVYDLQTHHIHQLNSSAAAIWRMCDGRRTVRQMVVQVTADLGKPVDAEIIDMGLKKLAHANLVVGEATIRSDGERSIFGALSRRATMKGVFALPVIISMTAPTAAMAASDDSTCVKKQTYEPCNADSECCSNKCWSDWNPARQVYESYCYPN